MCCGRPLPAPFALIFPMRLATTFRARYHRPGRGKPGAARIASSVPPACRGGYPRVTGTRLAFGWARPGYTPQISQRRAQTSVSDGWQDPGKAWAGAQEEEQLWGSK